jgi:small subunit ribosomal protein S4e
MSKGHLKKVVSPKSWVLARRQTKFVIRPSPGPHPMEFSLPLGFLLKERGFGATAREIKKIINTKTVLVDNRRVKSPKFPVGLMDVVCVKESDDFFRVVLDAKGRLKVLSIKGSDAKLKPCRVNNKTVVRGGKIQLNLFDSRNILTDNKEIMTGDSVVIDIASNKISDVLKFEKGAFVFLTGGHHIGDIGVVRDIAGNTVVVESASDGVKFNTERHLVFVAGRNKEVVKLR